MTTAPARGETPATRPRLSPGIRLGIVGVIAGMVLAVFVVTGLQDNMVYYRSPSELSSTSIERVRLGGMVQHGTVDHEGETLRFTVTDGVVSVPVIYQGTTTGVFREGQGAVVEGKMQGDTFMADNVLVMHDNQYVSEDGATYDPDQVREHP